MDVVVTTVSMTSIILTYDYVCTIEKEVDYIWTQPFTIGTALFFCNRYFPFVHIIITISLLTQTLSPEVCSTRFKVGGVFTMLGIVASQAILLLRTYAIWSRKRWVLLTLVATVCLTLVPGAIITAVLVMPAVKFQSNSGRPGDCHVKEATNIIAVPYISILLNETVVITLTLLRTYRHLRFSRSSWVHEIHQQGALFYCYMFIISIANAISPFFQPSSRKNIFAIVQNVAHSVLCNRVIFAILKQRAVAHESDPTLEDRITTLRTQINVLSTVMFDDLESYPDLIR